MDSRPGLCAAQATCLAAGKAEGSAVGEEERSLLCPDQPRGCEAPSQVRLEMRLSRVGACSVHAATLAGGMSVGEGSSV